MPKERKPAHEASPCYATAMRKASRRLTQLYDDALEQSGLRSTQLAIMAELDRRSKKPPTMAELASALVMDRSALGHNLRPLERDGLIVLLEGEKDRRRRNVALTSRGEERFREAKKLWQIGPGPLSRCVRTPEGMRLRATLLAIAYDERLGALKD